ncbi:MAG: deoxyribodipyrimidine photo-lyase [Caldimicrobium sp.]|nr:deoxyribodipyrimidine photo-lyase [Caldimicrobium sp.]
MEASQRASHNHALETALFLANQIKVPLLVYFGLTDRYRYSNARYYKFMLEGIVTVRKKLLKRRIGFIILREDPPDGAIKLAKRACLLVFDRGYLRHQRTWRNKVIQNTELPILEVEGEVVLPIEFVSTKEVSYARVLRPRIYKYLPYFLETLPTLEPKVPFQGDISDNWERETPEEYLESLNIDKSVTPVEYYLGGEDEAHKRLEVFVQERLFRYARYRSDPGMKVTSELSPYLRFGQISPTQILKRVLQVYPLEDVNVSSFVNELVVWRELARNYAWFNTFYNQYEGLPKWARATLDLHAKDPREYLYDVEDLERANTHDPYWNSAQRELLTKGTIHNYMRMYWCKKLLEWTEHPRVAFDIACYLNDKYALDGRDPNGYSGISWCFGAFDRPFPEKPIFGKVRKMGASSLLSKPNLQLYLEKFKQLPPDKRGPE